MNKQSSWLLYIHNQHAALSCSQNKTESTANTLSYNKKKTKAVAEQIIQIDPLEGSYALGNLFSHNYLLQ